MTANVLPEGKTAYTAKAKFSFDVLLIVLVIEAACQFFGFETPGVFRFILTALVYVVNAILFLITVIVLFKALDQNVNYVGDGPPVVDLRNVLICALLFFIGFPVSAVIYALCGMTLRFFRNTRLGR